MVVNPVNVINLLLVVFQSYHMPPSPLTNEERNLAASLEIVLKDAMENYFTLEYITEEGLAFQEEFKDWPYVAIDDNDYYSVHREVFSQFEKLQNQEYELERIYGGKVCTKDDEEVSFEYKKNAVRFWTGCRKKNRRSLSQVQNKYRRVVSNNQLYCWEKHVSEGGTRMEKIKNICEFTLKQCKNALESGLIFHDLDIKRWALQGKRELGYDDFPFKASSTWTKNFKKAHRIVSRKVNKFITKKTLEGKEQLEITATEFVKKITDLIPSYGLENIYNSDESGFQLEMHSGRTLATAGTKKVECVVKSLSSTTHSYTIQPVISADGKLLPKVFIILKEQSGGFGPIVERNLFRPNNIYITASTSGKSTSGN